MDITATSRYIRISPRKMQLLIRSVSALPPKEAVTLLSFMHKSGAAPLKAVIESALANATSKNAANTQALVFKHINVLPGSAMKRFRPVSRGMAHTYKKRMSHVKVVLAIKENTAKKVPVVEEKTKQLS